MSVALLAPLALLILGWSALSGALARRDITGPLIFVAAGALLANDAWGILPVSVETGSVHTLAELSLALVLFSDAVRIDLKSLRRSAGLPARMLLIGMPLTLALGTGLAVLMLTDLPWELAFFVAAALAPTDAALSAQVISDRRVPAKLRTALNVESGLNDGLATPVVALAIALAAESLDGADAQELGIPEALLELGLGVGIGLAIGALGAWALTASSRRGWAEVGTLRIGTFATAIAAFSAAVAVDGNGFVAAFAGGLIFGIVADREECEQEQFAELSELGGELLTLVVWFLFGAALVPIAVTHLSVATVGYSLLSLTLIRAVPVAISLMGTHLSWQDVAFLGWFGPRGLASVVFALLALEELTERPEVEFAVGTIATTVLLSVILHGATAGPAAARYGTTSGMDRPGDRRSADVVTMRPRDSKMG
ncbi:NhaP-type Na+/H+ or K+/H+ antiporter [Paraoerskovia marina]|uniref:NhaP-type Na+/H+ or K+/H+ antiporter n=1 Tax=Paraoerskovia marina TaxID=545619 RepID=A0A1H1PBM7_9CELL|nr:cation:proton antiporter [Paraoerskovia marina]SDS08651.1 NhaP-type Na+/H+ or K+/H+ antiporter [Paraoerskovia marina]